MSKKILKKLVIIFLFISIFLSFFLYKEGLRAFFFQDDWFTLRISSVNSLTQIFKFFIPRQDVIYYRPLGMQIPFFILYSLFGVNSLPFHILTFFTHAVNIVLVFFLIRLLTKNAATASLSAFMYGVSAVHYIPMFWSATYAFVLGPTFFFLSFILYILSLQKKEKIFYLFSIGVFILGLLTNELVAVLPLILLFYQLYLSRIDVKKLLPFFIIVLSLFVFRFIISPPPVTGSYQIGLSKEILLNLRAYVLWSFNWPEELKAQFISAFKINPLFIRDFSGFFWIFAISLMINIVLFYFIPISLIVRKKDKSLLRLALFSAAWFMVALSPVILFPKHTFSYYLPIALIGLLLISVSLFRFTIEVIGRRYKWIALITVMLMLANWFFSSGTTIYFNRMVHWAPRRAKLSRILTSSAKTNFPMPVDNIVFIQDSSENKLALNNQDGLKVLYGSDKIMTVYGTPQIIQE